MQKDIDVSLVEANDGEALGRHPRRREGERPIPFYSKQIEKMTGQKPFSVYDLPAPEDKAGR